MNSFIIYKENTITEVSFKIKLSNFNTWEVKEEETHFVGMRRDQRERCRSRPRPTPSGQTHCSAGDSQLLTCSQS